MIYSHTKARRHEGYPFGSLRAFVYLRKTALALCSTALLLGFASAQAEEATDSARIKTAKAAAQQDILDWNYRYKVIGHPTEWKKFLIETLDSHYDLEITEVRPNSDTETEESVAAYNEVICKALNKRYGYDVIERETSQAKQLYAFYQQGKKEASRDLKRGLLRIQSYGFPMEWAAEYGDNLRKKYGITIKSKGCILDLESDGISRGYNEVMTNAIIKKFGRDVMTDEARKFTKPESPLHVKGRMDAERDIANGKLKLFESKTSTPWVARYCDLLTTRFGIEILDSEWMEQQSLDEYCWGYDDAVEKAVKIKFGPKAMNRANQQAQRELKSDPEKSEMKNHSSRLQRLDLLAA